MKKVFYIVLPMFILAVNVNGQNTIDSVLANIEKNNKNIFANTKYWEARKLEFQTGLTPYNPKVDYSYLFGSPATAGNQTEFKITQSFDFPTVYGKKKQRSNEQIKQAEFHLAANRQDVLLEAKLICIELIYRNKLMEELSLRKQNTENWLAAFQKSLERGEGNIMDVNKAQLQLIEINAAFRENLSLSNQLNLKLAELNGGIPVQFSDTAYSLIAIPDFETLVKEIEANDPIRKYLEQEKVIGQQMVEVSKALNLPKIETGYQYQAMLGQRFNGVYLGLTIPLWENKNKVNTKQAEVVLHEANLINHNNVRYYDIRQKYERLTNLKIILDQYQALFSSIENVELLDKSLALGHITTIEYFIEIAFYYEAYRNYLKTEMEYQKVAAELFQYQL